MLTSFPVTCPQGNCGWSGSLIPSRIRGGERTEVAALQRAWFQCPRCRRDWEARIHEDKVIAFPALEHGG